MHDIDDCWSIRIQGGVTVCVRPTLDQMTTYVLLEQEDWFEDEMGFIRSYITPDMNALDIGANHGVYGLSIAARAKEGRVWAFEPTHVTGSLLGKSIALNGFSDRMNWIHAGLSNRVGEACITTSLNSEQSTLHGGVGDQEAIRLITLDGFLADHRVDVPIGFVKLDVEGEEINVLKGGHGFFSSQSPLVMFELKHGGQVNHGLIEAFQQLGYGIYRLVPGVNALTEYDAAFDDPYLLNLFACKPDRVAELRARELLAPADEVRQWVAQNQDIASDWAQRMQGFPYARAFVSEWESLQASLPLPYRVALSACLQSEEPGLSAVRRMGLLHFSLQMVEELSRCSGGTDMGTWLTKLTVLHRLGYRDAAVSLARELASAVLGGKGPTWPFVVPLAEFATHEPIASLGHWLVGAIAEFIERRRAFSSYFATSPELELRQLVSNPNHSIAVDRRDVLAAARGGHEVDIPPHHPLLQDTSSPNAIIWRRLCFGNLGEALLGSELQVQVVDVGASSHGRLTEPYAALMLFGLARVTGFEPNEAECVKLNQMYGGEGRDRYLPAFVGKGGAATFHETNWFMTGSLLSPNDSILSAFEQLDSVVQLVATHPVQTVRLADLSEVEDVDLIKIDVQGAELDVFHGAGAKLDQALVIWSEVEFLPLYENQPLFSDVEAYLRSRGFLFYAFDGISTRAYKPYANEVKMRGGRGQAIWSDAIFVRDFRTFNALSTDKLKKLAVLLDLVVRSRDLCHRVLTLIDQREATAHARSYLGMR